MPTRFNIKNQTRFNVEGLKSGYEGIPATDISIPPVGVEDVDVTLFNLFDKEIPFQVSTSDKNRSEVKKVPIIFSSAEKWALAKRQRALRDRNGSLILPLITVIRTEVNQSMTEDITGRGINQQTGEIVIKRKLGAADRGYQNLINRMLINHQPDLAVDSTKTDAGQVGTSRQQGDLSLDPTVVDGGLLMPDKQNNIYEFLTIPAPQFFTATYEVTFWTQYTVQMSQLLDVLMSSFLPQGNAWKLSSTKGYWFVATVSDNAYVSESNTDDMSLEERIIKYKFTVKVPGYILASPSPGAPVPVKKFVSSPSISFNITTTEASENGGVDDVFLGADDPTLPLSTEKSRRSDQRLTNSTRLYPNIDNATPEDLALKNKPRGVPQPKYKKIKSVDKNGNVVTRVVRVTSTNRFTGETTFSSDTDLGGISFVITDD